MRRPLKLHLAAVATCVLFVFAAPAANAHTLFDVSTVADMATATVVPAHVPSWVQVALASAPLYTSDSADAVAAWLPRHTFLRVLGAGTYRLNVEAYDESGNPAQQGWLDASQVLPSAPATNWFVTSAATSLWSSADADAAVVHNLDQFAPIQAVDGPTQGRMQIRVYRTDFSAVVDQGWVDVSSTGPALPPHVRVPSPTERPVGLRSVSSTRQQQDFLDATASAARLAAAQTGVPASVTVAQAILESDWGRSGLAVAANNYFGMKTMGSLGSDGVVYMTTSEYDDAGEPYQTVAAFRAYRSLTDSLTDHDRLLQTSSRYALAMRSANDPRQFASLLAEAGYATDPAYASKLVALMDRYNLYQLDS